MEASDVTLTPNKSSYEELKDNGVPEISVYPTCDESNPADAEFVGLVYESLLAIESGVQAELIKAGSSGSYFVKDRNKVSYLKCTLEYSGLC